MIPLSAPTITGNETKHLGETIKKNGYQLMELIKLDLINLYLK